VNPKSLRTLNTMTVQQTAKPAGGAAGCQFAEKTTTTTTNSQKTAYMSVVCALECCKSDV